MTRLIEALTTGSVLTIVKVPGNCKARLGSLTERHLLTVSGTWRRNLKLSELLTEQTWVQGPMAVDSRGEQCAYSCVEACKWCLVGAMFKCNIYKTGFAAITDLVKTYGFESISRFNDHPNTTFGMVKGVIETYESTLPAERKELVAEPVSV